MNRRLLVLENLEEASVEESVRRLPGARPRQSPASRMTTLHPLSCQETTRHPKQQGRPD